MLRVYVGDFVPTNSKCEFFVINHRRTDLESIRDVDPEVVAVYRPRANVFCGESAEELRDALSRSMERLDFLGKVEIVAEKDLPILEDVVEFLREQNPRKRIELFYEGEALGEEITDMVDSISFRYKKKGLCLKTEEHE